MQISVVHQRIFQPANHLDARRRKRHAGGATAKPGSSVALGNQTIDRRLAVTRPPTRRDQQPQRQARTEIAKWRRDYNEVRPHGSIGRIPPARFAEQHRRHAGDAARHLTPASNEIQ